MVFIYLEMASRQWKREKKTCRWCHGRQSRKRSSAMLFTSRSKQLAACKSIKCHPRCFTVNKSIIRWLRPSERQREKKCLWIIKINLLKSRRENQSEIDETQQQQTFVNCIFAMCQKLANSINWCHWMLWNICTHQVSPSKINCFSRLLLLVFAAARN